MIFKDYYKILDLKTSKVTIEEIKIAFREQAKRFHPDVNGGNGRYEERFKDINEAYNILSKPNTRRRYDRQWNSYTKAKKEKNQKEQIAFKDLFGMFFGTNENSNEDIQEKKQKYPIKGENVETEISVGLEEAFYGLEKKIALRTVNRKNENI